jgi:hypothetical protein
MFERFRKPAGFRLSATDIIVLLSGGLFAAAISHWSGDLAIIAAVTVGHFFLFCNVFRIRRSLELIWAALFVVNVGILFTYEMYGLFFVVMVQIPITIAVIAVEMRTPRYHGIFWKSINPSYMPWPPR